MDIGSSSPVHQEKKINIQYWLGCSVINFRPFFSFYSFLHNLDRSWLQFFYYITFSFLGSLVLVLLDNRNQSHYKYIDMLYMSTSSLTMSGLNPVEMESFSTSQIMVLTILMLLGGDVFVSMLCLLLKNINLREKNEIAGTSNPPGVATNKLPLDRNSHNKNNQNQNLHMNCTRLLSYIILVYHVVFLTVGFVLVFLYFQFVTSAREVLKKKGIPLVPFVIMMTVSSFVNCGFIPTNENMIIFIKNSGLLIILLPQVCAGNTLFSLLLRFVVWCLSRLTRQVEFEYMLKDSGGIGFGQLLTGRRTRLTAATVVVLLFVQVVFFCLMDWNSDVLDDLNVYQKIIGIWFQSANSRHAGESVADISRLSPAVLLVFIVMMYLPPNTSFDPMKDESSSSSDKEGDAKYAFRRHSNASQITYIAIFTIIICIFERKGLSDDPLNYNLLFILVEVISAYGNVGFSTGYSCKRLLKPDSRCKNLWISFSGKWSNAGKLMIIIIMIFGRLKIFHMGVTPPRDSEGVRVQVFFFLLSLSLVFLTTTARSSESDASRQDELEQLRFKIDALESTIVDKNLELKSKDGTILHMGKIIQEKSEGINSLQRELESIQKKDYLNDVELLEKANAQIAKLGKQVHELQDEIRLEKQKRVELEGRASKAEMETKETSDDQKRMFEKTESSLKISKIHAAWFPPWLAIHVDHYLDMAASHWNRHAKPALDVLSKEASKIACWAQKHMEPHWHLVKSKCLHALKEQCTSLSTFLKPHIKLVSTRIVEFYNTSLTSLKPYFVRVGELADPYVQEVQKFSKPYVDQVTTITRPHIEKVHGLIEPYTSKAVHVYTDFLEASASYYHKVQAFAQERLKKHELTEALATKELSWFLASALLALPVYLFYKLLKTVSIINFSQFSRIFLIVHYSAVKS